MTPRESLSRTLWTILLAVLIGGASGAVATAVTVNYLLSNAAELNALLTPLRQVMERRGEPTYEEEAARMREKLLPSVAAVFARALPEGTYDVTRAQALGIVLTSDGWVLAGTQTVLDATAVVAVGQDVYPILQQKIFGNGFSFLKIDAPNLPVVAFGKGREALAGDRVFALPAETIVPSTLSRVSMEGLVSSDVPERRLAIPFAGVTIDGTPIASPEGKWIGLVEWQGDGGELSIVPIETFLPLFQTFLRSGTMERASLGMKGYHLVSTVGLSEKSTRGYASGFLVSQREVVAGAAREAGVKPGDVILSVDGRPINREKTLDEFVMDAAPGEQAVLQVDRGGKMIDVRVTFGRQR